MPEEFKAWLEAMSTLLPLNVPGSRYRRGLHARHNIFDLFKLFIKDLTSLIVGKDGDSSMDVLQMFLDARDEEGHPLTEAEVIDQLLNFIFVGHDTSTATICTMLHFMGGKSQQPAMEKMRAGVEQILPRNGASSFDALVNALYLEAFLKEVLQLGAPVPARLGEVLKDTEFSCPFKGSTTAYQFPERSTLVLDYRYGMRDDEYFARHTSSILSVTFLAERKIKQRATHICRLKVVPACALGVRSPNCRSKCLQHCWCLMSLLRRR